MSKEYNWESLLNDNAKAGGLQTLKLSFHIPNGI